MQKKVISKDIINVSCDLNYCFFLYIFFFLFVGNASCNGNQRTYNNGIYFGQIQVVEILKFIYQLFTITFKWHVLNIDNVSVPDVASIETQ